MLWTTDRDGYCTYLSKRWFDYTGRTPEQDIGFGWLENVHIHDLPHTSEQFMSANAAHRPFSIDYRLRGRNGQYRWAIDVGVPRFDDDGQPLGYVGTVVDVHDLKMLQERSQTLANELGEKNRLQSEFLVTLAHELRNPLAPIRSGLELLRTSASPSVQHDVRDMLERQVGHMVHLVDDLLDMARLTSGKLTLRPEAVLLDAIVRQAVEISMPLVVAAGHQLSIKLPEQQIALQVDRHRIAQVLSNLLNNAAKYTPQGGSINLSARVGPGQLVIDVADNGVGLAPDVVATVFDLYAQVAASEGMSQGGLGVGLSLAQRLVQLHGGQIRVASEGLGLGSCFSICLPYVPAILPAILPAIVPAIAPAALAASVSSVPAPAKSAGAPGVPRKVLLVDDNVDAAETLAQLLELTGYEVMQAYDGATALARAAQFLPEIVLLDIGLPDMDGYEVAQALRLMDGLASVTLVALTGWGSEQDRLRSSEAGFDLHLTKPVDFMALKAALAQVESRQ